MACQSPAAVADRPELLLAYWFKPPTVPSWSFAVIWEFAMFANVPPLFIRTLGGRGNNNGPAVSRWNSGGEGTWGREAYWV